MSEQGQEAAGLGDQEPVKLLADGVPLGDQLNAAWAEIERNVQWLNDVWVMVGQKGTEKVQKLTAGNLALRGMRVTNVLDRLIGEAKEKLPPANVADGPPVGQRPAAPVAPPKTETKPETDVSWLYQDEGQAPPVDSSPPSPGVPQGPYNVAEPGNWSRDKRTDQFVMCVPVIGGVLPAVGQKVVVKNRAGRVAQLPAHEVGRPFVSRFGDYEGREVVFVTPPPRD